MSSDPQLTSKTPLASLPSDVDSISHVAEKSQGNSSNRSSDGSLGSLAQEIATGKPLPTAKDVKAYSDEVTQKWSKILSREVRLFHQTDGFARVNGFVQDGVVYINADSGKAVSTVLGHELTHVIEGTREYTALVNGIKGTQTFQNILRGTFDPNGDEGRGVQGVTYEQYVEMYRNARVKAGESGMTTAQAEQEIVADFIGNPVEKPA